MYQKHILSPLDTANGNGLAFRLKSCDNKINIANELSIYPQA